MIQKDEIQEKKGLRIKDLLRKLQFLRKGEQLLWEPIDQRNGNRGALSGLGPTRHPPPPIRSIRSAFTFHKHSSNILQTYISDIIYT